MYLINKLAEFLVSTWLWNLTFAFSYVFISTICMTVLLKVIVREGFLRALLLSVSAQVTTVIIFSGIVVGLIMHIFNWQYSPEHISEMRSSFSIFRACLSLGIVYSLIQSLFFWLIESHLKFKTISYIIVSWISNGIASFICYWIILWVMSESL